MQRLKLPHFIGAAILLLSAFSTAQATPSGHLAFIQNGFGVVSNAASSKIQRLPNSARTQTLTISLRGDAVYFVLPPGKSATTDRPLALNGFVSRPPYTAAKKLPSTLQGETPGQFQWNQSGTSLWIRGFEINGVYSLATNTFRALNYTPDSVSRDGKLAAYLGDDDIRVREIASGRERIIFSRKKPQILFNAIRSGKNQKKLRELREMLASPLENSATSWAISAPALSPDGKRLYFCSNAGTGQGAAGNSTWAIFSADLKNGKIAVLSTVGTQFGRMPEEFEVSPAGKRLLAVVSVHSSAIENPCYALVVDLLTQKSREILQSTLEAKNKSNLTYGAAWSPDGKYVAIAAYFYDLDRFMTQKVENWNGPHDKEWLLLIKDAATGKTVRRLAGARSPSWGR